jgi:murein DD-endopeptidase MepM/ murein hydrolase activator NlpD
MRLIVSLISAIVLALSGDACAAGRVVRDQPGWPVVFELDRGESLDVLGQTITLVSFEEHTQPDHWIRDNLSRKTIASADVVVDVRGPGADQQPRRITLKLRPYEMPVTVGGIRLYVETTKNWGTTAQLQPMADVQRDVRLSARPAGEPWGPAELVFPIRGYRWRSSTYQNTWTSLVPYNLLYYHRGEDLGAIPDKLDVAAIFAGTVTMSPLPNGDGKSNGFIVRHASGVETRYGHMNLESLRPESIVGSAVKAGQVVGKTGMTWAGRRSQTHDPHLHVGLTYNDTPLATYPFLIEAYFRSYPDALLPVAGNYHFALPNEPVRLDGSRSLARPGRTVVAHEWRLSDGRRIDNAIAEIRYDRPGLYSEELIVRGDDGSEDHDFAQVRVFPPEPGAPIARGWVHATPMRGLQPGKPVTFWNRLMGATAPVSIDFGDATSEQTITSELSHTFAKPGTYTITFRSKGPADEPATVRLRVVIEPASTR